MSVCVLGVAVYPTDHVWANVDLLARSVALNSPNVELAFITAPLGPRDRRLFEQFNVRAIALADPVPVFDRTTDVGRRKQHAWMCELFGSRHSWYLTALASLSASHVLITDTRDVVLTGNLAAKVTAPRLVLSRECDTLTLGTERWNSQWLRDGYGDDAVAALGSKSILCAGVVFGPIRMMRDYVGTMSEELARLGIEVVRAIGDQPVHNFLAYNDRLPPYDVSAAETGWMKSVGLLDERTLQFDWLNPSSNAGGERTLVLHQYDRHVRSWRMSSAIRRATGLAWWKNLYSPFDAHPGVRLARVGSRIAGRLRAKPRS